MVFEVDLEVSAAVNIFKLFKAALSRAILNEGPSQVANSTESNETVTTIGCSDLTMYSWFIFNLRHSFSSEICGAFASSTTRLWPSEDDPLLRFLLFDIKVTVESVSKKLYCLDHACVELS